MSQLKKYELDVDEFLEILENYQLILDSSEQPRQRPESSEEQKKWYSGKKKNHTFKNQLIVLPSGEDIVDIDVGCLGKTSDITLFRGRKSLFSEQQKFMRDKAYIGFAGEVYNALQPGGSAPGDAEKMHPNRKNVSKRTKC